MMDQIRQILKQFDARRTKLDTINDDTIASCFAPVAEHVLLGGCLYVNGNNPYKIDIQSIELYYHEEQEGGLKDPIMYHTNLRVPTFMKKKGVKELPYYKYGSLNLHTSGVDFTFENEQKQYRASFLIREYRVLGADEDANTSTKPYDPYSTHIFDDLFPYGVSAETLKMIEWREEHKEGSVERTGRYNVKQYYYDAERGKYVKDNTKPCTKPWQFYREKI